jgi:hypothetical protein
MSELDDAELLASLGHVFDVLDPVPEHLLSGARDAIAWQRIDAALAELIYDSDGAREAAVRGADTREVTFRAPGIEVGVMVVSDRHRSLVGQVVPAQQTDIELLHDGGSVTTRTDALGRFSFDRVAPGAVKLVLATAGGTRVQTEGLVI